MKNFIYLRDCPFQRPDSVILVNTQGNGEKAGERKREREILRDFSHSAPTSMPSHSEQSYQALKYKKHLKF